MTRDELIKNILDTHRQEVIEECVAALQKKVSEGDGWDMLGDESCCPGDDCAFGFNQAISQSTEALRLLKIKQDE